MDRKRIQLRVSETAECPLYRVGDLFTVSGIAVVMDNDERGGELVTTTVIRGPGARKSCRILGADLNRLIIEHERADLLPEGFIMCSGCSGSAVLENNPDEQAIEVDTLAEPLDSASMLHLLQTFPFFRNIDRVDLRKVVQSFRTARYAKNDIIIRKGDQGDHFYVVVAGRVQVLNEAGLTVATLGPGDVFGEMSLLSEDCASATVQAAEDCELIYVDNREFKSLLARYPTLQDYFTRLLAKRLSDANRFRTRDFLSILTGRLEEFPPEALFQSLHAARRTGILTITQLPGGNARFSFRQGGLIKASYQGKKGKRAFFDILKEREGLFKFTPGLPPEDFDAPEIGYFMKLLMLGLREAERG
ncbi:MAG: hypothetical protein Kow0089_12470 [Desulfobulbaceae bacterium]